jgi:hypothetical protein
MREFSQPDAAMFYNDLLSTTFVAIKARGILEDWLDFYAVIDKGQYANKLWR